MMQNIPNVITQILGRQRQMLDGKRHTQKTHKVNNTSSGYNVLRYSCRNEEVRFLEVLVINRLNKNSESRQQRELKN